MTIFIAVLAVLIGSAWLLVVKRPMSFMSDFDVRLTAKIEMAKTLPPNAVVILGDSGSAIDLVPNCLGRDVVNLGLEMSSPIEAFRFTQLMLSSPHPPRAILVLYGPWRLNSSDRSFFDDPTYQFFFDDAVSAGLYDRPMLDGLVSRARALHEPLPGAKSPGDIDFRLTYGLKLLRFPSFYFPSLLQAVSNHRQKSNLRVYDEIRASAGHVPGPVNHGAQNPIYLGPHFRLSPVLDAYFSDMLSLLRQRDIPVFYLGEPVSDVTAAILPAGFRIEYVNFIENYKAKYPNFHPLGDPLPQLSWHEFGDPRHLSPEGAIRFSDHVAQLLREAYVEK